MRPYRLLTPPTAISRRFSSISIPTAPRPRNAFSPDWTVDWNCWPRILSPGAGETSSGQPRLRFITLDAYIIAYFPEPKPIAIVAILHGSRDLTSLLQRPH